MYLFDNSNSPMISSNIGLMFLKREALFLSLLKTKSNK